jgi:hypothetical protein
MVILDDGPVNDLKCMSFPNPFEDWIKTTKDRRSEFSSDEGEVLLGLIWSAAKRWKRDLGDKSTEGAMWMIIRELGYKLVSS